MDAGEQDGRHDGDVREVAPQSQKSCKNQLLSIWSPVSAGLTGTCSPPPHAHTQAQALAMRRRVTPFYHRGQASRVCPGGSKGPAGGLILVRVPTTLLPSCTCFAPGPRMSHPLHMGPEVSHGASCASIPGDPQAVPRLLSAHPRRCSVRELINRGDRGRHRGPSSRARRNKWP